ncbi:MAG: hypothetical protein RIC55_33400 [Pirellulaceae bacterium]
MMLRTLVFTTTVGVWCSLACAQSAIQLPTFSFTTVNTTVTAPDGGTVLLGGIKRASEGSTTRGVPLLGKVPGLNRLFNNRGIGRSMQASNMSVVPRIIILEEEEERQVGRVLAARRAGAEAPMPPLHAVNDLYRRRAEHLAKVAAQQSLPDYRREEPLAQADPFAEVEAVRRENALAAEVRGREAVMYFEKAQAAEEEGKEGAARVYYGMAAKRAKGQFKDEIQARLEALK